MFKLAPKPRFNRDFKKLVKKQPDLAEKVKVVLAQLQMDPRDPRLKSHKARDSDGVSFLVSR